MTADFPFTVILTTPTMMMVEIRTTITTARVVSIPAFGESWKSAVDEKVKNLPRIYNTNYYKADTQNNNVVCPLYCVSSMLCVCVVSSKEFVIIGAECSYFSVINIH